ncbi:uncharacterized protein LOC122043870 [Zingiber officinale]|uniref:Uncharacterized protein n=1 Tax=Zingiber officinale TaxID=94328 RepID=A0A8J5HWF7_ZINOF|nr:uncharacterized protein LOC122043870 [Zingiber officinale]KAG6528672.1 hypothetical protein ZIOFF_010856 [Zingiber officinale]
MSLQIWDNAAFDDGGSASKVSSVPAPPPPLREVSTNASGPQDLDPCKENRGPEAIDLLLDATLPKKAASRVAFAEVEEISLDDEIVRIEEMIARLSSRLEALRVKKADRDARGRPRGRIVPAKFMDPCTPALKRMDREMEATPASARNRRRAVSLGPLEILATPARSMNPRPSPAKNIWPTALKKKAEEPIAKADRRGDSFKMIQLGKATGTLLDLGKLENIEEDKETKRAINTNPKSQQPATARKMIPDAKKTVATPGNPSNRRRAVSLGPAEIVASTRSRRQNNQQEHTAEKAVKLDNQPKRSSSIGPASPKPSVSAKKAVTMGASKAAIRPKAPFQDNKNSTSCNRPSKAAKARVVPSRYNSAGTRTTGEKQGNKRGKWSLPELCRGTGSSSRLTPANKRSQGSELEDQMKLDSQISDDLEDHTSPESIMKLAAILPKIKASRCNTESPRDSGCAKRASELVGRKPFFSASEDEVLNSPGQALTILEDLFAEQQP